MLIVRFFNTDRPYLLLLLPFILLLQETHATESTSGGELTSVQDNAAITVAQNQSENSFLEDLESFMETFQKTVFYDNDEHLRIERDDDVESRIVVSDGEGVTFSFYDYDNKYAEVFPEVRSKNPSKHSKEKKNKNENLE